MSPDGCVVNFVDRLGIAYAANNREFLCSVAHKVNLLGGQLRRCLQSQAKLLLKGCDPVVKSCIVNPFENPVSEEPNKILNSLNANTVKGAQTALQQIRELAMDALGSDLYEVLGRIA